LKQKKAKKLENILAEKGDWWKVEKGPMKGTRQAETERPRLYEIRNRKGNRKRQSGNQ